jgi:A/G-specific adenine glycosylase
VQLPGIGLSTSAALLAFAFDQDEPMIDTNIRRVLTRVFFHNQTQKDVQIYQFAKAMIPKGKGRAWNYAMLDIAATECCKRNHKASCVLTPFHGKVIDQQSEKSQKPFFQSQRYWRGKIVDYLRAHERVTESKLSKLFPECDSLEKVLESLLRDGMLKKNRTAYVLPE